MPDFLKAELGIMTRIKNELSKDLTYHSYFHTLDVMNAAMQIAEAESITPDEQSLLRVAIAYHDSGFIEIYKDHEEKGCHYAKTELPSLGFSQEQIEIICGLIMATKISEKPSTRLQEIISDADLDYLGRHDYKHTSAKLFQELKLHDLLKQEIEWRKVQMEFLTSHTYHTSFSKKNRNPVKQENLINLQK